jgi:beta-xylosidase
MNMHRVGLHILAVAAAGTFLFACGREDGGQPASTAAPTEAPATAPAPQPAVDASKFLTQPLIKGIYTADPSAHVFDRKIFIYPSHDIESGIPQDDLGSHFAMRDYHVFSMDTIGGQVTDHGVALDIANVPWAGRQMWAPDAALKDGKYYLYFPAKDKKDVFRIGVAEATSPAGPFTARPEPIQGTFSIDPAVFKDDDGKYYMYFGGIWGGQLQRWASGTYKAEDTYPANDKPALSAKVARLGDDMVSLAETPRDVVIQDENGKPLTAGDNGRRFFEASWLHKYNGTYYFSYSTGDTHFIVYGTSTSPYGPFTYKGKILEPVLGWTNHHSIVEFQGKWYLFYHDAQLSGGQTHLRNVKVTELHYRPDGSIETIDPYTE